MGSTPPPPPGALLTLLLLRLRSAKLNVKVYQSFSLILSIYVSFPIVSEQTFAILFKIVSIGSNWKMFKLKELHATNGLPSYGDFV